MFSRSSKSASAPAGSSNAFLEACGKLAESGSRVTGPNGWVFESAELAKLAANRHVDAASTASGRAAIKDYAQLLEKKNIKLVVALLPSKAVIFADQISKSVGPPKSGKTPLRSDTGIEAAAELLEKAGINVVDLTPDFLVNRLDQGGAFTPAGDSLTPMAAQLAAGRISRAVGMRGSTEFIAKTDKVSGGNEYGGEPLSLPARQVFDSKGVGSVPLAEGGTTVVMLCDGMGIAWARERTSLAEQLSFELKTPLSVIESSEARNGPRLRVMREASTDRNPLRNAKVVIWVLPSSALASNDWNRVPLSLEFRPIEPTLGTN